MQNLVPLVLIGLVAYLFFSRRGGMGCCGGHTASGSRHDATGGSRDSGDARRQEVIELGKDDYQIIESRRID